jgi:hypothetical protein
MRLILRFTIHYQFDNFIKKKPHARSTFNQASEQDNNGKHLCNRKNDEHLNFRSGENGEKAKRLPRSVQARLSWTLYTAWSPRRVLGKVISNFVFELNGCSRLLENNSGATTHLIGNPECQRLKVGETIVAEQLPAHKPIDGRILSWTKPKLFSGEKIVDSWFQSRVHYNTSNHEFVPAAGSFTQAKFIWLFSLTAIFQMLWRDTKEIGIAVARNKNGKAVIVCNYYPPGNIRNEFEQNVPVSVPPEKKLK